MVSQDGLVSAGLVASQVHPDLVAGQVSAEHRVFLALVVGRVLVGPQEFLDLAVFREHQGSAAGREFQASVGSLERQDLAVGLV